MYWKFNVMDRVPEKTLDALRGRVSEARIAVAEAAMKDTMAFVPSRTGSLRQRTHLDGNFIVYPGPYAQFLYFGNLEVGVNSHSPFARAGEEKMGARRVTGEAKKLRFGGTGRAFWFREARKLYGVRWVEAGQEAIKKYGR